MLSTLLVAGNYKCFHMYWVYCKQVESVNTNIAVQGMGKSCCNCSNSKRAWPPDKGHDIPLATNW